MVHPAAFYNALYGIECATIDLEAFTFPGARLVSWRSYSGAVQVAGEPRLLVLAVRRHAPSILKSVLGSFFAYAWEQWSRHRISRDRAGQIYDLLLRLYTFEVPIILSDI